MWFANNPADCYREVFSAIAHTGRKTTAFGPFTRRKQAGDNGRNC